MSALIAPTGRSTMPSIRVFGRDWPIVLPSRRDPRLRLAAVIITLQILGQTVLHFELSIAQILISVLTCATLEVGVALWRRRVLLWPASALLTGNGLAFLLRVPGTRPGDWWTLRGGWIFFAAATLSMLSKFLIRPGGRHLFNPSNLGLVVVLLVLGSRRANPQDLWWGRMSPGLALTLVVIVVGGLIVVRRVQMLPLAIAFGVVFTASITVVAATGHCMAARWHTGPLCGASFWTVVVTSPELLVFVFFMITDPKTAPSGRAARMVFGGAVGYATALLAAPQTTEFGTKVAILGGLCVVCALRPIVARVAGRVSGLSRRRRVGYGAIVVATGVMLLIVAGHPARPRRPGEPPIKSGQASSTW